MVAKIGGKKGMESLKLLREENTNEIIKGLYLDLEKQELFGRLCMAEAIALGKNFLTIRKLI